MSELQRILEISSVRHTHLCPRQVLGARIGLAGAAILGMGLPRRDKCLLIIIETDGCFADGVEAATGCTVGHRTLRIEDYGKIAATFINTNNGEAYRLAPQNNVRQRAMSYGRNETRRYFVQLQAYQIMPLEELLMIQPVFLNTAVKNIVSQAGVRINCHLCGEEIINEREVIQNGQTLCRTCALGGYYTPQHILDAPNFLCGVSVK